VSDEAADFKLGVRYTYAAGDYAQVAALEHEIGPRLVERLGVSEGIEVLDVGTGTGNFAIPAAAAGVRVVGLDLTPEQLSAARARAEESGVEVEWVEGDAESLPFEDGRFDIVASMFGVIFAPRHAVAAAELRRVCKRGGTIAVCAWTPDSIPNRLYELVSSHLPPAPPYAVPPGLWGEQTHVQQLLGGPGTELTFEHDAVTYEFGSVEEYIDFFAANFGPLTVAKDVLTQLGTWDRVRTEMRDLLYERNEATGGGFSAAQEFLVTICEKGE
jgi:SAM-dependent methyltransferase